MGGRLLPSIITSGQTIRKGSNGEGTNQHARSPERSNGWEAATPTRDPRLGRTPPPSFLPRPYLTALARYLSRFLSTRVGKGRGQLLLAHLILDSSDIFPFLPPGIHASPGHHP